MKILSKLLRSIFPSNNGTKTTVPANEVDNAIEHVVDSIEPAMRYFPGYKKILRNSVSTSLDYINNLVNTIPGPLFISSSTFTTDPQVNVYFATVEETREIFSNSAELREFFETEDNKSFEEAYALLCMNVEEKAIMGMELQNDIVRRDVLQTALNFSDHKIMSAAKNESDVRKGIKTCIFNCLVTYALQEILDIKQQKLSLEIQRKKLASRLKARQSQGDGLSSLINSVSKSNKQDDINQEISDNTNKHEALPTSWDAPRYYLETIKNTLSQPENFISIEDMTYDVTKMGIVSNGETQQSVNTIHIDKIVIANVLQRAVAIVRYPRKELLPRREFNLNESSIL